MVKLCFCVMNNCVCVSYVFVFALRWPHGKGMDMDEAMGESALFCVLNNCGFLIVVCVFLYYAFVLIWPPGKGLDKVVVNPALFLCL